MTISLHDPKLTAYALGELEDEERAEVEKALTHSPALREEVEAIRATAERLREALGREAAAEPLPAPLEIPESSVEGGRHRGRIWFAAGLATVAVSVVLASVLSLRHSVQPPEPPRVGELAAPPAAAPIVAQRFPDQTVPGGELAAKDPKPIPNRVAAPPDHPSAKPKDAETRPDAGSQMAVVAAEAAVPVPSEEVPEFPTPPPVSAPAENPAEEVQSASNQQPDPVTTPPAPVPVPIVAGRVRRSVFDASGAVVPGVEVQLIDHITESQGELPMSVEVAGKKGKPAGRPALGGNLRYAPPPPPRPSESELNTEAYDHIEENRLKRVADHPLSTFSIDVDTASYSNVRRYLLGGTPPPPDAVRIEELINYFPYDDLPPTGNDPFSVNTDVAPAPWDPSRLLLRIALKGKEIAAAERPAANLVFLVDVSGSMQDANKLPLLKGALRLLVGQLQPRDRVAMVVYAGASGLALPPTLGSDKPSILAALEQLEAGGSTNGGEGIRLAYATARENFVPGGINRVILATDGDFNVGVTNQGDLTRLIEDMAKDGVFLTVLGFGMGNYKDSTLEKLADKGNGNYGYVDSMLEARKLLVEQVAGTLVTIAKDVKIQVEFNPAQISAYRLIGYENRRLAAEDFNDDRKDAGEIGAGHSVTALYELTPAGAPIDAPAVDPLKYQTAPRPAPGRLAHELLTVKLRYKRPDEDTSRLIEKAVVDGGARLENTSDDFRFAAAVACFGMLLRDSPNRGSSSYEMALGLARRALGPDRYGYRTEFVTLVEQALRMADR